LFLKKLKKFQKGVDLLGDFHLNPASLLRRITGFTKFSSQGKMIKTFKKYLQFENETCRKVRSQGLA